MENFPFPPHSDHFWRHFDSIDDPRKENHNKRHTLKDIVILTILAILCGAENWVDIELFGRAKQSWLRGFLTLPNGIPSHDTLGRVFSLLNPKQLQSSFLEWTKMLVKVSGGDIIAIDGKTLRRSHDQSRGKKAIHMVSAWASTNAVVLGQVKTEEKSNEITAIPELLEQLMLKGNTVTIDAMGCQKEIVKQIVTQEGDYVLALKGNRGTLREDVQIYLEDQVVSGSTSLSYYEEVNKDHGRIEIRRHWMTDQIAWLEQKDEWAGLRSIWRVESERHIADQVTKDRRFYISALPCDAKCFADSVRGHWGVENRLHWCLDVCFNEDQSRVRIKNAAENLAVIRHIALNSRPLKSVSDCC